MTKDYLKQVGIITDIQELYHVKRINKPDIYKRVFTFTSVDGQIHYPEIRNQKLKLLDYISEGDTVEIQFLMQGSEKNGKKYNNILIHSIKPI